MTGGKTIVIVSPNQMACLGLKMLLQENFPVGEIIVLGELGDEGVPGNADIAFLAAETYIRHQRSIRTAKARIIVLTEDDGHRADASAADPETLAMTVPEEAIVERLGNLFSTKTGRSMGGQSETLTPREVDVLRCVSQGYLNKQIADVLSISQHTVISHRKNITQKLGIKTVSGLTMYALLHGLITSKEH